MQDDKRKIPIYFGAKRSKVKVTTERCHPFSSDTITWQVFNVQHSYFLHLSRLQLASANRVAELMSRDGILWVQGIPDVKKWYRESMENAYYRLNKGCRCKIEFWPHWISTRGVLIQRAVIKIQRIFHVELRPPETGGHCITTPPTDKILTPPVELWPHLNSFILLQGI